MFEFIYLSIEFAYVITAVGELVHTTGNTETACVSYSVIVVYIAILVIRISLSRSVLTSTVIIKYFFFNDRINQKWIVGLFEIDSAASI